MRFGVMTTQDRHFRDMGEIHFPVAQTDLSFRYLRNASRLRKTFGAGCCPYMGELKAQLASYAFRVTIRCTTLNFFFAEKKVKFHQKFAILILEVKFHISLGEQLQ